MEVHEISLEESLRVLARTRLARLACARDNQPYIVPVYLAYDGASSCLYGFTTPGQKVEWMRSNPLVCVEVDEVAAYDQWISVIAFGQYEELPENSGNSDAPLRNPETLRRVSEAMPVWTADSHDAQPPNERERAWQVLQTRPEWDEPGWSAWTARAYRDSPGPFIPVYYRIRIDRVTGHKATSNKL